MPVRYFLTAPFRPIEVPAGTVIEYDRSTHRLSRAADAETLCALGDACRSGRATCSEPPPSPHAATNRPAPYILYVVRALGEPVPELELAAGETCVVWSDGTADRVRRGSVDAAAVPRAIMRATVTLEQPEPSPAHSFAGSFDLPGTAPGSPPTTRLCLEK